MSLGGGTMVVGTGTIPCTLPKKGESTMLKRMISFLVCLCLLMAVVPVAMAEEAVTNASTTEREVITQSSETDLPQLSNPTNLGWNDGWNWPGMLHFYVSEPTQMKYEVRIYHAEDDRLCSYMTLNYTGATLPREIGYIGWTAYGRDDLTSGSYYFTVQALADGVEYRNSDVVRSEVLWNYQEPEENVAAPSQLTWDGATLNWSLPEDAGGVKLEIYYAATSEAEPVWVDQWNNYFSWANSYQVTMDLAEHYVPYIGAGYYSVRLCTLSGNLEEKAHSEWVMSTARYITADGKGTARLSGANRYETAIQVSEQLKDIWNTEQYDAIIVASGNDFADALAGSYLSTCKQAPILLSWGKEGKYDYLDDRNIDYIRENLAPGRMVYILGGTNAVPSTYEAALNDYKVVRLAGSNRYETNQRILKETGIRSGEEILVCTGTDFADSLSASAVGKPILMATEHNGKIYGLEDSFLTGLENCSFTIIGGSNAVSNNIENRLSQYGSVKRLSGKNRFETSVMVAQMYFQNPDAAVLTYAWNFPDGLCGGALAYAMNVPLILTMDGYESAAAAYTKQNGITDGIVLGGDKLISNAAVETILYQN